MGHLGVRLPPNAFAAYLARGIIGPLYRAFGLLTGLPVRALPDYANPLLRRGLGHPRPPLSGRAVVSHLDRIPGCKNA